MKAAPLSKKKEKSLCLLIVLLFVLFEEIAPAKATTKFIINIVISISDWSHIRVNFACMPNIFTCCT